MPLRSLGPFLALTFGLTWGIAAALILFPERLEAIFGAVGYTNPLFILAVYSPGFAGLFLVWRRYGLRGLGRYARRLTMWRMPLAWWVFLAIGTPALFYLSATIKGSVTDPFPYSPWFNVLPALAVALFVGPIEELGWRGLALPLLQQRFTPLWSGLILGVIWGLWHVPAFLLSGTPQSSWSFAPYFIAVVAISVILTPMFNAARGSILVAVLFHFQMNGPAWPDAQPWDTLVFALAAFVIVLLNLKAMLTRDGAVTDVLGPLAVADRRSEDSPAKTMSGTATGRRMGYGLAMLLAGVGVITAAAWGVTGVLDQVQRPETFVRAAVPGRLTVTLTQVGTHVIYYEGHDPATISAGQLRVVDTAGRAVPVRPYGLDLRYDVPGKPGMLGTAVGVFDAQTTGSFSVRADAGVVGGDGASLAIGDDLAPAMIRAVLLPGLAALLSVVASIALAARTWSGRERRNLS
jgi:membrane protease YdiL (CAAX protease family)